MIRRTLLSLAPLFAGSANAQLVEVPELGLRIAPGFEITRYADHALAPDIYSMALDPDGAVVISSRGYIKAIYDRDRDGRAESEAPIRKGGPGAMGMLFLDKTTLLTTEGGKFNRYTDKDGDGAIDGEPETLANFGGGEHGVHALRRDREGHIYLIGGNDAKLTGHAMIDPEQGKLIEGGAILKFAPDLEGAAEVVAHGFRNPYDFDLNAAGEIYCYDSDCEREFFLPWYSPTRLYAVEVGAHHGWRLPGYKRGWKRPDYYPDSVRPLVNVGRGSPTGVAVYRHGAFPAEYHGGVFYCDWTFGKVYFTHPDAELADPGGARAEVFIESTGTNGFAPTDIEIAADGSLFLSMGGRGTTGAVFHVRPTKPIPGAKAEPAGESRAGLATPPEGGGTLAAAEGHARLLESAFPEGESAERLAALRWMGVALGDWNLGSPSAEAFTGYELGSDQIFEEEHEKLLVLCRNVVRPLLHTLDADERREASRLLAMLRDPHPITTARLLDAIAADSPVEDDFHYLACLARVASPLDDASVDRAAAAVLALDGKLSGRQLRSKQTYTDRLNEVIAAIATRAPSIYEKLLAGSTFAHPNHAGIAAAFPEALRVRVADRFLDAVSSGSLSGWREDSIGLLEHASSEKLSGVLRHRAAEPALRDRCVLLLARSPAEVDRPLYRAAATSLRAEVAAAALGALAKLPPSSDAAELLVLFRAADQKRALPLIARAAKTEFADRAAAEEWLRDAHPEVASAAGLTRVVDDPDWPQLFARVDWSSGDEKRGEALFASRACAACHASANPIGPDLAGAAKRLSAADLFSAIAMPDADVPPAYRATVFTLKDGGTRVGRIAFNSADGVIIQTAPGVTLRIDERDIAKREEWKKSLMPAGLLAGLKPGELADLYAYMKTL